MVEPYNEGEQFEQWSYASPGRRHGVRELRALWKKTGDAWKLIGYRLRGRDPNGQRKQSHGGDSTNVYPFK